MPLMRKVVESNREEGRTGGLSLRRKRKVQLGREAFTKFSKKGFKKSK